MYAFKFARLVIFAAIFFSCNYVVSSQLDKNIKNETSANGKVVNENTKLKPDNKTSSSESPANTEPDENSEEASEEASEETSEEPHTDESEEEFEPVEPITKYPFLISIEIANDDCTELYHICLGSLITEYFTITAGDCFSRKYQVCEAMPSIQLRSISGMEKRIINKVFIHPEAKNGEYTKTRENDVGLVKTNKPFTLSDKIKTINLNEKGLDSEFTYMAVSYAENSGAGSIPLYRIQDRCDENDIPYAICTIANNSVYPEDSGGPLLNSEDTFEIYGVLTYLDEEKNGKAFAVYATIHENFEWIDKVLSGRILAPKFRTKGKNASDTFSRGSYCIIVCIIVCILFAKVKI